MSDTEIHDLLVEVAHQVAPVDLYPRVQKGMRARRRRKRAFAVGSVLAVVGVVAVAATHGDGSSATHPGAHAAGRVRHHNTGGRPSVKQTHPVKAPSIKLVVYRGRQLAGYTVDEVPAGWVLAGVNSFALTINPAGDPNPDPSYFVGKLVVSLQPAGDNLRTDGPKHGGTDVTVNGRAGLITWPGSDPTAPDAVLSFYDAAGDVVDVLVPPALGWTTPAPFVAFGDGIHVLGAAQASVG